MTARLTRAALILALAAQADTLRLRSGATLNGSYLGGTRDEVRFMVGDNIQNYRRSDVAELVFTSIAGGAAPPSVGPIRDPAPKVDPGPDIAGAPYLRGANGYIALEREFGMMTRDRGMGPMGGGMGGATVYRIQGQYSPVRVRQGDTLVFVIRMNSNVNPRGYQLYRLEPRMGYRQTQPTMGGMPPSMPLSIRKVSDTVYEMTPPRLYPGEYAVSPMNSNESYCFGVDN